MGNPPRGRKRVRHPCRAPDGSAFQKCDFCGASVHVALMCMHECQEKKGVKRFKGKCESTNVVVKLNLSEEPRSSFQFFLESYAKKCRKDADLVEVNRQAFEQWKKMSDKERGPFVLQADKVDKAYLKILQQEAEQLSQEADDEANSATVTKFALATLRDYYEPGDCEESEDSGGFW